MPNTINAVNLVKKAAVDAVEASKPVQLSFGTVVSVDPLKIQVDQKAVYTEKMLILTRNITDFETDVTVSHKTEETEGGSGESTFSSHSHRYEGKKKMKIHNALILGDQVLLMRIQKGKRFVVLDRIKPISSLEGEWL